MPRRPTLVHLLPGAAAGIGLSVWGARWLYRPGRTGTPPIVSPSSIQGYLPLGNAIVYFSGLALGVAFSLLLANLFEPVQQLSQMFNMVQSSTAALAKLFGLLDTRSPLEERLGAVDLPITCGGLTVRPGDHVYGDADGVVVVPAEQHDAILEQLATA